MSSEKNGQMELITQQECKKKSSLLILSFQNFQFWKIFVKIIIICCTLGPKSGFYQFFQQSVGLRDQQNMNKSTAKKHRSPFMLTFFCKLIFNLVSFFGAKIQTAKMREEEDGLASSQLEDDVQANIDGFTILPDDFLRISKKKCESLFSVIYPI